LVTSGDTLAVQVNKTEFSAIAVNVALWLLEIIPAVAVKVVANAPAGTMTQVLGTGSNVLLLDSNTTVPPAGAIPINVTVQVVVDPEFKLFGLQTSRETEFICPRAASADKTKPIAATTTLLPIGSLLMTTHHSTRNG
jgi:hypothetical protein